MCSVCWEWDRPDASNNATILRLVFNRDEQITRAIASFPRAITTGNSTSLMPIDPDRGGTWIATNDAGLTIALLNNYSHSPTQGIDYASRGNIVKELSSCQTIQEAQELLEQLVKSAAYPAFTLCIWEYKSMDVQQYNWDGHALSSLVPALNFHTSSSWKTTEVQEYRHQKYQSEIIQKGHSLEEFMSTTEEGKEEWGVMMTRLQTRTVSTSIIEVSPQQTTFTYQDRLSGKTLRQVLPHLKLVG